MPDHRIHVVPNGIDVGRFRFTPAARTAARARLGLPRDAFVVGGVGRLVPPSVRHAVRAVADVPGAQLLLVGEATERPALEDLAARLGAADRIRLLGERDGAVASPDDRPAGLPGLLAAMDVLVSPSAEEAFGLAALEALAAGCRCCTPSARPSTNCPPEAAPAARRIAPGAAALADALRRQLAAGPRRYPVPDAVERYDIARGVRRLMDLYDRTATCGPGRLSAGPRGGDAGGTRRGRRPPTG